jgi:predicted dehydrogenase
MDTRLRVGVVGAGVGQAHLEAYQSLPERFEVLALCDLDQVRAREVASASGVRRVSCDLSELCRLDELDVIDICTPSHLHARHTLQALAAGKHVICEKPVAGSLGEVDALIDAEWQSSGCVMPIFQNRFGRGVQKLKLLIDSGLSGDLYLATIETAWRRRAPYYAGWRGKWASELGGALMTLAIHAHDVLYYLCGPATRVFARTATLVNDIETEDTVSASVEMAGGGLASLSVTTGSPAEVSRWRVCFSEFPAESQVGPYASSAEPWSFTGDSPEAAERIKRALADFVELPEGFAGQFYRFYDAVKGGAALPVTLGDARASLELITAMYHSARTGRDVALPIHKDHPLYASLRPQG